MSPCSTTLFSVIITLLCIISHLGRPVLAQHWYRVDDTDPAIKYSGPGWLQGPCGDACLYPVMDNVVNGTWHMLPASSSTGTSGITFSFTGYAIVVGGMVDNIGPDAVTALSIVFDGTPSRWTHSHDPSADQSIQTGTSFFQKDALEYKSHTVTILVDSGSVMMLDYIAVQDSLTNTVPDRAPTSSSPPVLTSSPLLTTTNSVGSTITVTSSTPSATSTATSGSRTISGSVVADVISNSSSTTVSLGEGQSLTTIPESTSTDVLGHTYLIPATTIVVDGTGNAGSTGGSGGSNHGNSSSNTGFSPALAGAIGAAVAAVAAASILVFLVCMRRKRQIMLRPGSAEPYMLANSTPSSQNSNLSARLSPFAYPTESVLGLFVAPQSLSDRSQPDYLLSSPPPNHSLMSPISPNHSYNTSQNPTITISDNYLQASTNSNSLSTPISPQNPQPFYQNYQNYQTHQAPQYSAYPNPEKLHRQASNQYSLSPLRQSAVADLRSPVTPLVPRPPDWNIESLSEDGRMPPTPGGLVPMAPRSPMMVLPSPVVITPSPQSPGRRRGGRHKELFEDYPPPPQVPSNNISNVPILGHPSVLRRARRGTDGAEMRRQMGLGHEGRNLGSDEESLPPVVRRQSLSHPAPPAYSPPRLVRNTDLGDVV